MRFSFRCSLIGQVESWTCLCFTFTDTSGMYFSRNSRSWYSSNEIVLRSKPASSEKNPKFSNLSVSYAYELGSLLSTPLLWASAPRYSNTLTLACTSSTVQRSRPALRSGGGTCSTSTTSRRRTTLWWEEILLKHISSEQCDQIWRNCVIWRILDPSDALFWSFDAGRQKIFLDAILKIKIWKIFWSETFKNEIKIC